MKMMETERIERYVNDLLEVSGVCRSDEAAQPVRRLLHHLYTAVAMYELMGDDERGLIACIQKKLRYFFSSRCDLKERKRNREKEKSPLHPSYKEKETEVKVKEEKQTEQNTATGDAVLEGFRKECLRHVGQYGQELVEDFYYHWKQVDKKTGKRLFEGKRCFDIDSQLRAWSKSEYTLSKETAALRLEHEERKRPKQQAADSAGQQQQSAEREEANARLEREIAERKAGAVSYEEYLKMKAEV